ncbi:hypothetical protein ARMSODRAFT_1022785 [Armillaria solidipes]|uniref:Ribonuclease H1 N-terminal domain-containing protein n=1 Tax=Armillaria solidipes TaxID=1076256 RepID=A0A2H3BLP6_9AGAR|nr:hypothetical protein ARMSODRAFT_1022785 [Armillaria solidipes]
MADRKLSLASKVSLPVVDNSDVLELAEVLMNTHLTSRQAMFLVSTVHSRVDSSLGASMAVTVPAAAAPVPAPPPPAAATTPPAAAAPAAMAPQVIPLAGGDPYHIPSPNQAGPFYLVTKGKEPGVYAGWNNVSIQVIGVPGAMY